MFRIIKGTLLLLVLVSTQVRSDIISVEIRAQVEKVSHVFWLDPESVFYDASSGDEVVIRYSLNTDIHPITDSTVPSRSNTYDAVTDASLTFRGTRYNLKGTISSLLQVENNSPLPGGGDDLYKLFTYISPEQNVVWPGWGLYSIEIRLVSSGIAMRNSFFDADTLTYGRLPAYENLDHIGTYIDLSFFGQQHGIESLFAKVTSVEFVSE